MIYVYILHVLFYLGQLSHFPSCFGTGVTNLNKPPLSFCCLPITHYCGLGAGTVPFKGHCKQKSVRDEGVIFVAGHPWLNRRCTRLSGCIRLLNDVYCVGWGVELYSLTYSRTSTAVINPVRCRKISAWLCSTHHTVISLAVKMSGVSVMAFISTVWTLILCWLRKLL